MKNKISFKALLLENRINKKVFLGGTCGSEWRNMLIPELNSNQIDYFNPIVDNWNEEAQEKEIRERENCDYCLYTITPNMTGVYSIAEVVDDSNKRPEKTILCILNKDKNGKFNKEQLKSLQMVSNMVECNGAKSFNSLNEVMEYLKNEK